MDRNKNFYSSGVILVLAWGLLIKFMEENACSSFSYGHFYLNSNLAVDLSTHASEFWQAMPAASQISLLFGNWKKKVRLFQSTVYCSVDAMSTTKISNWWIWNTVHLIASSIMYFVTFLKCWGFEIHLIQLNVTIVKTVCNIILISFTHTDLK